MAKLIYSMSVSLDGYIADRHGAIDWSVPDEELHRFHNERVRGVDLELYGRRLYETMRYWETAEERPSIADHELEFARIWKATPKLVFSRTLDRVESYARLVSGDAGEEVARLKRESEGTLAVGGAGLASGLIRLDLVDEYQVFVSPVVLGGGTPFFPELDERIGLELVETRTFASRVVYVRYRREEAGR
jgi:dihydrofolate reductase